LIEEEFRVGVERYERAIERSSGSQRSAAASYSWLRQGPVTEQDLRRLSMACLLPYQTRQMPEEAC
jgi:hypothetical protein